jgi:hypothetical protein
MKDEISNGQFWEKYIKITDGDIRPTFKDYALSRKDDVKEIGFDYRNNVFTKTISGSLMEEPKRAALITIMEALVNYLIDSVKHIKKHNNFAISKKWRDFN